MDDAGHRRGHLLGRVANMGEAEPLAWQLGKRVQTRIGATEVEHVDQDASIAPFGGPHYLHRSLKIASLGPMRKLEVDENSQRLSEIAKLGKPRSGTIAVRIGQLRDDVLRTKFGGRFEDGDEALRIKRRVHAKEFNIEHLNARVRKPGLRFLHKCPIVRQVVERLVWGYPRQAQTHVS